MHALALTHSQLRAVASLTAFASRDEDIPTITGIRLEVLDGRIIATATDRYRVAELTFPAADLSEALTDAELATADGAFPAVTVPAAFLARVVKSLPRRPVDPGATVAVFLTDEAHRITVRDRIAGLEMSDGPIAGNFPPVVKLFPAEITESASAIGVRLNAAFLASLEKLSLPSDIGTRSVERVYTMQTMMEDAGHNGSPKPRPVVFTRDNRTDERDELKRENIRAMIQPNTFLR